ncbi:MAG: nucleoside 2-deoxyribosyltransferase domain-containing protein [Candidatus Woesearchaeota archaeon]
MRKIKVYLSARISKDAHRWNNHVCDSLKSPISVFMPQRYNPWNVSHKEFPKEVYDMDLAAMKESDICLLLPKYGRDCAWEIGWYGNSNKPIVVYVDNQVKWLRDWMIKGGVDYVITTNHKTWKILIDDPILKFKKIVFIEETMLLNQAIIKIYNKHYNAKKAI